MDRQQMFSLNLSLLIGILFFLLIAFVLTVVGWTLVKTLLWRRRQRRAEREDHEAKLGPHGRPLPPAARGVCERCGMVFDEVYHLPTGRRLCWNCYAKEGA